MNIGECRGCYDNDFAAASVVLSILRKQRRTREKYLTGPVILTTGTVPTTYLMTSSFFDISIHLMHHSAFQSEQPAQTSRLSTQNGGGYLSRGVAEEEEQWGRVGVVGIITATPITMAAGRRVSNHSTDTQHGDPS